eukprot:54110_1
MSHEIVSEENEAIMISTASIMLLPFVIYHGYELYRNWNEQYIVRRRRSIILLIYIIICYYQLFYFPFNAITHLVEAPYWLLQITYISSVIAVSFGFALVSIRIYLLYFDHEYNHILITKKWKILVDPLVEKNNWFLINRRNKYGSSIFVMTRILLPLLFIYFSVFISLRFTIYAMNNDAVKYKDTASSIDFSFAAFSAVAASIVGIYFWKKYPNFNDNLLIRKEIKLTLKLYLIYSFFKITMISTMAIFEFHFGGIATTIVQFICVATLWLMIKYPQRIYLKKKQEIKTKQPPVLWKDSICTKEQYESFANFLEKEFSIENLLFITEYMQLKKAMLDYGSLTSMPLMVGLESSDLIKLPDSIPLSLIAKECTKEMETGNDVNDICFNAMDKIFWKYIDESSALEVNISSFARLRLQKHFRNNELTDKNIENILPSMEVAVNEVSSLMRYSFGRFTRSKK